MYLWCKHGLASMNTLSGKVRVDALVLRAGALSFVAFEHYNQACRAADAVAVLSDERSHALIGSSVCFTCLSEVYPFFHLLTPLRRRRLSWCGVRSACAFGGGGGGPPRPTAGGALFLPSVSPPLRRHQGLCTACSYCRR